MLIRPLVWQDRNRIEAILRQGETFNESEIRVAMELVDEVLKNPDHPDYLFYTALFPPDDLAGYICYGPVPMTAYCFDLYWIAVDRQFFRQGIAARLTEFMETDIRKRGGKHIYVDTSSTAPYAPARAFYEKQGYRPVCTLDDFFKQGDHKVIFRKELPRDP